MVGSDFLYRLPVIKGAELALRTAFTLLPLFLLDDADAGQFGLMVTATTLFSFIILFERHIDFQRSYVDQDNKYLDLGVMSSLRLFLSNFIISSPLFSISIYFLTNQSLTLTLSLLLVSLAEALFNFAYLIAIVDKRYEKIVFLSVKKNIFILVSVLTLALFNSLTLQNIWFVWGSACLVFFFNSVFFYCKFLTINVSQCWSKLTPIWSLYKRSHWHFFIGLIAVLLLQIDRLIVAAFLDMTEVGIYYRHVAIVALTYQAFNILIFNQWIPKIYGAVNAGRSQEAACNLNRIYLRVAALTALLCPAIYALLFFSTHFGFELGLRMDLLALLIAAAIIRFRTDFNNLLLNAHKAEIKILQNQIISFLALTLCLPFFIYHTGPIGAALGTIVIAALYCGLSYRSRAALRKEQWR